MSILDSVITNQDPAPPKIVAYGVHGVGKSTFAANPKYKPIFIDIEGGLKRINAPKLPRAKSWAEVDNQLAALIRDEHDYKSVIVDTVDWVERLIEQHVAKQAGVNSVLDIPFGKGYAACRALMDEFLLKLDTLNDVKGMMVILLGHSQIKTYASPTHDPYDRYGLKLNDKISSKVEEWADVVAFVNYKLTVKKAQNSMKETNRALGSGERQMYLTERPSYRAKNRYMLPDKMSFNLDKLVTSIYDLERAAKLKADQDLPDWM